MMRGVAGTMELFISQCAGGGEWTTAGPASKSALMNEQGGLNATCCAK